MQLNLPLEGLPLKPDLIINLDVQSQQKQSQEITGQKCTRCEITKPLNEFSENRYGEHKFYRKICKTCRDIQQKSKLDAIEDEFGFRDSSLVQKHRPPEGTICNCCEKVPMTYGQSMTSMCFDHDPVKGKFRGWICKRCNVGLGNAGDDDEGVMNFVRYLTLYEITN